MIEDCAWLARQLRRGSEWTQPRAYEPALTQHDVLSAARS
jgi:hypothetical protein